MKIEMSILKKKRPDFCNYLFVLLSQQLAIKRQEKEFLSEFEELRQQFKEILTTTGINQSQFPVTPNRNLVPSDPMTPTFLCTPRGLTDLDIHKCLFINTLNDSKSHGDRLTSDGSSEDEGHSPMSTDTELSDLDDDTVFLKREIEGCENQELNHFNESLHFSTSFVAGHVTNEKQVRIRSSGNSRGQGSNPLASSTMMEDVDEGVHRKRNPVRRGVSIPKASSTLLYKPFPERKVNKSFSPVVKIKDLQTGLEPVKESTVLSNNNTNSIFTWSLQPSSTDVPLEEAYLRTVRKRSIKPYHLSRQVSKVKSRSHKMASRPNLCSNEVVNGLSVIADTATHKDHMIVDDGLLRDNTLYNKTKAIPRSSTRTDLQRVNCVAQGEVTQEKSCEGRFRKPTVSSKDSKVSVERNYSVVKKLFKFRESLRRKNGTTDLHILAVL
jgi:hypothetical protein